MSSAHQYMLHANPVPGARVKGPLRRKSFTVPLIELLRPDGYWPQPLSIEQAFEVLRWMATTGSSKPEFTSQLQWGRAGIHELLTGGSGLSHGRVEPITSIEDLRRRFHFAVLSRASSRGQEMWRSEFGIRPEGTVTVPYPTYKPFAALPHLGWRSEADVHAEIKRLTTGSTGTQMVVNLNGVHQDCQTLHGVRIAVGTHGFALAIRYGDKHPSEFGSSWDVTIARTREGESFLQTFARARTVFDCLVHGHANDPDLGDMGRHFRPELVPDQVAAIMQRAAEVGPVHAADPVVPGPSPY